MESEDKSFRLTGVKLRYRLKIPRGKRAEADRALELHENYCPVHQTIRKGFRVSWSADIEES